MQYVLTLWLATHMHYMPANVLAIVFVLIGGVALLNLPVAQYPNVVPLTVQVTARYPGASAQVVEDSVTSLIEQEMNGLERLLYMESSSDANGIMTLTLTLT